MRENGAFNQLGGENEFIFTLRASLYIQRLFQTLCSASFNGANSDDISDAHAS